MIANGKLYTTVMEKLNFEPRLDAANITISVQDPGIVVLGGTVKSYIEKTIAENAVKNIPGIRAVADELEVDSSTWKIRTDAEIAKAANSALDWNVFVPKNRLKLVVEDGDIKLSGEVEWHHQKESALFAVKNLLGVKSVINNIVVKPSIIIDADKVKQEITKEFERNARLDASKVVVEVIGKRIILKGEVLNLEEVDEAVKAAWSIPGVSEVQDHLKIA